MAAAHGLDLLIAASNFSGYSGPNSPLLDLGNFLSQRMAFRCAVVTHSGPVSEPFGRALEFPVYRRLSGSRASGWTRMSRAPGNVARLRRALQDLRPRRVLAASGVDVAFELSWALRRPILLGHNVLFNTAHRSWARDLAIPVPTPSLTDGLLYPMLDRVAAKSVVRGVLAHTEFHKSLYLNAGIAQDRIRLVPHAIDTKRFRSYAETSDFPAPTDDRLTVAYVGRLEPDKGIRELLEAAVLAAKQVPLRLRIVGSGHERATVDAYLRAHSGKDGLELESSPPMSRPQVAALIHATDLVAVPSRVEGFGMVALEAMTLGRPVLATRYGGIAEVVRDRVDGWLVDPRDVSALARALVGLGGDARLRRNLGNSGRERAETVFDVAAVAPRFVNAVESLS